jgi:hypothetical protein
MLKRNVTFILLLLLVPCFLMGQSTKVSKATKVVKLADDNANVPVVNYKSVKLSKNTAAVGESIGLTTQYDYFTNTIMRNQIAYWQGQVLFANMVRPYGTGTSTVRHIVFTQRDSATGVYTHTDVFGGQAGFPDIDVSRTDVNTGTIGVVGHTPNRLAIWDGSSAFNVTTYAPGDDPSFQFAGPNTWLATSGSARDQFRFYSSADDITFANWDSISAFSPSPLFWAQNGSTECAISKSPNEQYVVYYAVNDGEKTASGVASTRKAYNGVPLDSCDQFWTLVSANSGTSWTGSVIGYAGVKGLVAGLPNYAPLFSNFGQVDISVTNVGVIHAVANGYGLSFNLSDTTNRFPVLYYNSTSGKWITISNPAIDTIQDINNYYPGNALGNAYPSVSVSEDGKLVYVCWTGPELTNGKLDTVSDGGLTYWCDLYHTWSTDGGTTWKTPTILSGAKNVSETFANTPQVLRYDKVQGKYVADIVYLADLAANLSTIPGGTGAVTDNPLMYYAFTIPDVPTGVNDKSQIARSFNLGQNYPNPFNPSTKIDYTLPEKSNVSLKIYDMLGREVANLVNATQEAGAHSVNFNASKLASGMYIYTLKSGNNSMSKKLMLLK